MPSAFDESPPGKGYGRPGPCLEDGIDQSATNPLDRLGRAIERADGARETRNRTRRTRRFRRGAPEVSVVIPAKDEAASLPWVLRRLPAVVDEVVLVDGSATDDTAATALAIDPHIRVVRDEGAGKGLALRQGFEAARGDFVVMIDADGSMDPREIAAYVEELRAGGDLVKGSRYVEAGGSEDLSLLRRAGNRALCLLFNLLYGERFTDLCYGYCAFRRSHLDDLALASIGFEFETELVARASRIGLDIREVPSFEAPRRYGTSNLRTFRDGFRVLRTMLRLRFSSPPPEGPARVPAELELLDPAPAAAAVQDPA